VRALQYFKQAERGFTKLVKDGDPFAEETLRKVPEIIEKIMGVLGTL